MYIYINIKVCMSFAYVQNQYVHLLIRCLRSIWQTVIKNERISNNQQPTTKNDAETLLLPSNSYISLCMLIYAPKKVSSPTTAVVCLYIYIGTHAYVNLKQSLQGKCKWPEQTNEYLVVTENLLDL